MHSYSIEQVCDEPVVNIALDTLKRKKQALIFVSSKRSAQKVANDIAKKLKEHGSCNLVALAHKVQHALPHPTEQCNKLAACVLHGVAFHHAGLATEQKTLIEQAFRSGELSLIACTPTLAAGLDLPAYRAVLKDVKRYTDSWGMRYIPVLEYMQMAGRAGRPGKEDSGEAICIAQSPHEAKKLLDTFIFGQVEAIYSKLAVEPVLRTYVLSLVATGMCKSMQELERFFSQTFFAHQYGDMNQVFRLLARVITTLRTYTFLEGQPDISFRNAHELTQNQDMLLVCTPLGFRVSQLMIDPLSANTIVQMLEQKKSKLGIIHALATCIETRPLPTVRSAESEPLQAQLLKREDELLLPIATVYDPEFETYLQAFKTARIVEDWIDEKTEDVLLEVYDVRPGELHAKKEQLDWLLYCMEELGKLRRVPVGHVLKLRTQVSHGVKEELLPLLAFDGIGRVRARQLYNAGLTTTSAIKQVPFGNLVTLVGNALAVSLKKQVGETVGQQTL